MMPRNPTCSTRPSNPASETSKLLPPPNTNSATPHSQAQAAASAISSSLAASTNQRAGPPMPKVVKGASSLFSSRSIKTRLYQEGYARQPPAWGGRLVFLSYAFGSAAVSIHGQLLHLAVADRVGKVDHKPSQHPDDHRRPSGKQR